MTTFNLHSETLRDEWLDAYGHLNEAYYLVPMSNATWKLQDNFDIGVEYFEQTRCALYTVETHLRYLNDVRQPATMNIESFIIDADEKRIWFAHQMLVNDSLCATGEFMVLHYDTRESRTTPMPNTVQPALQEARISERPDWVGRQLSLAKR